MGKAKVYCIGSVGNKLPKQKYDLRSVTRTTLEASGYTAVCDHCGKLLVNHASIRGMADNNDYTVGLDCLKRLLDAGTKFADIDIYSWEYQRTEINNCLNLVLKIEKELKEYKPKDCLVYFDVSKYRPGLEINWITPKGNSWQTEIPFRYKDIFKEIIDKYSDKKKFEELYKNKHSEFVKSEYLTPGGGYYGKMLSLREKRARLGATNRKSRLYPRVENYFKKFPFATDEEIKAETSQFLYHINDAIECGQISESCAKYLHKNNKASRLFQAITKVKIPLKLKNISGLVIKDVVLH